MTLTILDVEQGSDAWHTARRGIITASIVGQLVSVRRPSTLDVACPECYASNDNPCAGKRVPVLASPHKARVNLAREQPPVITPADGQTVRDLAIILAADRITTWTDDQYESRDMIRGHLDEPLARDHYSKHHAPATECGFMIRDDWDGFTIGYSPDGLVGDDGLIEIKSRAPKKHIATILAGKVPAENMAQIQAGLLVSGRAWCDYISWCGGLPMWPIRVTPDPSWQSAIVAAVQAVEIQVRDIVAAYTERVEGLPQTEHINHFADVELTLS